MNYKAWIAVAVAGFAIGAGVNGLQGLISSDGQLATAAENTQQSNTQGQLQSGNSDFQVPNDGNFQIPDGPITLPDGSVVDRGSGTITLPDGTAVAIPERPNGGGFRGGFGGQRTP